MTDTLEGLPASDIDESRPEDLIESFETSQGSTYTYGDDGRTTRYKTVANELEQTQDLTVFVGLNIQQEQDVLEAYRLGNPKLKVYVVERQEDDTPKIVYSKSDVTSPDKLFLAIYRDGVIAENKPVTLMPTVGFNVFDTRHFEENGQWKTERHLGHEVTKINYK